MGSFQALCPGAALSAFYSCKQGITEIQFYTSASPLYHLYIQFVLDEATAFADAENEHKIQLAFEELTKGKSVLMIAHRLSTVQDADLILVFKDGKIIERGTHDELLSKGGTYAAMWNDYQTSISWKVGKGDIDND